MSKLFLGCEPWHLSVWFAVRWPTDLLCLGTLSLSGITIHQVTLMLPETKMSTQRWYPTHSPVFSLICLEDGAKPPFYIHVFISPVHRAVLGLRSFFLCYVRSRCPSRRPLLCPQGCPRVQNVSTPHHLTGEQCSQCTTGSPGAERGLGTERSHESPLEF